MSSPNELTWFTVQGYYYDIESPLTSGTTNADQFNGLTGAYITFTPRVPTGFTLYISDLDLGSGNTGSTAIALAPVTGRVLGTTVNGASVWQLATINTADTPGISLLSNSAPVAASLAAQGITQLIYDVEFTQVTFAGDNQIINNFAFVAPTDDTTVCISDPDLTRLAYGGSTPVFELPDNVTTFGASLVAASDQLAAQTLLGVSASTAPHPLATFYRPLQGFTGLITSEMLDTATPGDVEIVWSSAAGKYRYANCVPVDSGISGSDGYWAVNNNNAFAATAVEEYQPIEIEFWSNATTISVVGYAASCDVLALCDDQYISDTVIWVGSDIDDSYTWQLTQSGAIWHHWRITVADLFHSISVNTGAVIVPTTPRASIAVIGDSYVQGGVEDPNGVSDGVLGYVSVNNLWGVFEAVTGLDVWRIGLGAAGYTVVGHSGETTTMGGSQVIASLAAMPAMNAVIISGSVNDAEADVDTVVTAAQTAWAAIKGAQPTATLIVQGVQAVAPANSVLNALNTALLAAASDDDNVDAVVDLRDSNSALTGTGYIGSLQGDGNSDAFIGVDDVHPTVVGYQYLGENMAAVLSPILISRS